MLHSCWPINEVFECDIISAGYSFLVFQTFCHDSLTLNTYTCSHTHTGEDATESLNKQAQKMSFEDFPGGTVDKNPAASGGNTGLIPGPGRFHIPWRK